MADLKPCPFCGTPHVELYSELLGEDYGSSYVECLGCDAVGPAKPFSEHRDCKGDAEDAAVRAWNVRATMPKPKEPTR